MLPPAQDYLSYQVGQQIARLHSHSQPRIALLDFIPQGYPQDYFRPVRKSWYSLAANFKTHEVADLGSIYADAHSAAIIIAQQLQANTYLILLSPTPHLLTTAIAQLQPHLNQKTNICYIDSQLPFSLQEPPLLLNQLLPLCQIQALAFQRCYADPLAIAKLDKAGGELLRLGLLRHQIEQAEPTIRLTQATYFHLSAVRAADAPNSQNPQPIGLSAEEACKLIRYSAINDAAQLLYIDGYCPNNNNAPDLSALVLAQCLWFATEGVLRRLGDYPTLPSRLQQHLVLLKEFDQPVAFFHRPHSDRWWFGLPNWHALDPDLHNPLLLPCHAQDFTLAQQGELSERLWRFVCLAK